MHIKVQSKNLGGRDHFSTEFVDWIQLVQERTQWWALVNMSKEVWGFIKDGRID
jgi:hypothetical protein